MLPTSLLFNWQSEVARFLPLRLDGSTPAKARGKAIEQFQNRIR